MSVAARLRRALPGIGPARDRPTVDGPTAGDGQRALGTRLLALAGVALLLGAALQVMYHFISVVGVPSNFLAIVAVTLVAATVTARHIRPWVAVAVGAVLLVGGLGFYLSTITSNPAPIALVTDALALFAGQTLLRISNIHEWVLGVAPGPIFVTWYFAVRRWYTPAVLVAGGTLGFFVLTGDADVITAVTGVVGGTAALGFGDLEKRGRSVVSGETVVTVVAVMIIVPGIISVVPASAGASIPLADQLFDDGEADTLDSSLSGVDEQIDIQGAIELSPELKFSVTSPESDYWRVASYDRYTGDGWVRTGASDRYDGGYLDSPPGATRTVTQTVRAEADIGVIPAAWRPVRIEGLENLSVTDAGSLVPDGTIRSGETFTVRSQVPNYSDLELQTAGTDYPDGIVETYTQLPASTPDRVKDRTAALTADADTPYETARTIEVWLENSREYSLDIREPRGNVADAFLFEMDRGYCVYYATTMVTMLRTEGIPARFVTGYTPGERVAANQWAVRGENSHAWVEVYFPDHGWVKFDPTPAGPREAAEREALESARERGASNVDTNRTRAEGEWTPEPTPTVAPLTAAGDDLGGNFTRNASGEVVTPAGAFITAGPDGRVPEYYQNDTVAPIVTRSGTEGAGDGDRGGPPLLPTRHELGLGLLATVGVVAGVRRTNAAERIYRAAWVRYQPRTGEPDEQIERAFQRLVYHLESNTHRKRKPGETVRQWFMAIDAPEDAKQVLLLRERARYAGDATEADADEAVRMVDALVR